MRFDFCVTVCTYLIVTFAKKFFFQLLSAKILKKFSNYLSFKEYHLKGLI